MSIKTWWRNTTCPALQKFFWGEDPINLKEASIEHAKQHTVWDCSNNRWGARVSLEQTERKDIYKMDGHLGRHPCVGDYVKHSMTHGYGLFKVTNVYKGQGVADLFFGTVVLEHEVREATAPSVLA